MRSISIFRSLIRNIALPVILILLLLAFINIYQTKKILNESNQHKNSIITDEIKYLLEFRDIALDLLEQNLDRNIQQKSQIIIDEYLKPEIDYSKVNLEQIMLEIGMDLENEDIYIINSNGIVINATFDEDLNLNLFAFGSDHRNYLLGILHNGKFVAERFTIESTTRRLKKYCYQPTTDGKFILEIGTYSKKADNIINLIQKRLLNLSETDQRIRHIDLIMGADYPFSFNENSKKIIQHKDILDEIFTSKKNKIVIEEENGEKISYQYFYMHRQKTQLYKNSVIQIVTDDHIDRFKIQSELIKIVLFFVFSLTLLIIVLSLQSKKIAKPIKALVKATNNLLKQNKKLHFEKSKISELNNLSENFSKMSQDLNDRANELIEASLREHMKEREAEMAYKIGFYESVSSYLHHIGNSLTEMNHHLTVVSKIEKSFKQYPEIFITIREAHKKALNDTSKIDETLVILDKFETIITERVSGSLRNAMSEISTIKEQMMNSLKEQQRSFSSIKDQNKKLVTEIKINEMLQSIIKDFEQHINQRKIKVETNFGKDVVLYNQKQQIQLGLSSIITNAIEAIEVSSNANSGIIKITTKKDDITDNPFDYIVCINISDNGIGVSNNNINKIFRAGFTTKKMKSGLSLHNFLNFLKYNKGKLIFNSEGVNKGSTISLEIGNE